MNVSDWLGVVTYVDGTLCVGNDKSRFCLKKNSEIYISHSEQSDNGVNATMLHSCNP